MVLFASHLFRMLLNSCLHIWYHFVSTFHNFVKKVELTKLGCPNALAIKGLPICVQYTVHPFVSIYEKLNADIPSVVNNEIFNNCL